MRRIGRFRRTGPEPHLDFGASDRPAEVRPFVAVHGTSAIQGEMTARKRPVSLAAETVYPNRKRRFAGGPFMPQMRAPILITGRGIVSCLGLDVEQMAARILAGEGAIRPVGERLTSQRFTMGAPVDDFVPADHFDTRSVRTLDRFAQYAAVAGRNAWAEAGGAQAGHAPERIGVVVGTASAGIDILDDGFERIFVGGGRPSPLTIPMTMGNAAASRIAREIGARGPVFGVTGACASAGQAILMGAMLIRADVADVVVVGGADAIFNEHYLRAWDVLRVVSPDQCRPFSTGRSGLVLGEGAGMLVLERQAHVQARGAASFGRYLGGASSCDAGDLLAPDPTGMATAIRLALADARLDPAAVDYVNAHGTGTAANDVAEAAALKAVLGPDLSGASVSSTKSQIGHAMGASGALEAIVTLAALQAGIVPPTLGFLGVDPEIGFEPTPNVPRPRAMEIALSNSFAFGGLNVSLAFGR